MPNHKSKSVMPSIAIVILNYNGMKDNFLADFLPSVIKSLYDGVQLYVADNASTDNSVGFLRSIGFVSQGEDTANAVGQLIELNQNYWFAEGYNRALKNIDADYYVLLNSDVEVSENWIRPIIEWMELDDQIAVCQPKIKMYAKKNLFEHAGASGGMMDKYGFPFCRGRIFDALEEDHGQYDDKKEIFWASGAAFFIRAHLFHQFGGFDPYFKAHMEEIDLCWRLKRANYKIMVFPESVVWHVGGGTLPKSNPHKTYLNFRNSLSTLYKNSDNPLKLIMVRLFLDALAAFKFLISGNLSCILSIIKAHWSFFSLIPVLREKRKEVDECIKAHCYQSPTMRQSGFLEQSIVKLHFLKKKNTFEAIERNYHI